MAGIYIHIPFCKQRCHYCDFYSTTKLNQKDEYVDALKREIVLRKNYISTSNIETIYFGGGTPSVLDVNDIESLLALIFNEFDVSRDVEITFEANPDDLTIEFVKQLQNTKINRISLGVQSFDDKTLKFMNRRHSAAHAVSTVQLLKSYGFDNISIDLIYGVPNVDVMEWTRNVEKALDLGVKHISAYHLTIEAGTVFGKYLKQGKISEIDDDYSLKQYNILIQKLKDGGFQHYEISNFAIPLFFSRHNSSYWDSTEYLGFGASAHSFNSKNRSWNRSDVDGYIQHLSNGDLFLDEELLTDVDKYNEFVMTSLRTFWGIDFSVLIERFGEERLNWVLKISESLSDKLNISKESLSIKEEFLIVSDAIISEFFID